MWGAGPVRAQDSLEPIMTKASLSREDIGALGSEVSDRVRKLESARSPADHTNARKKLINPSTIKGATPAGLDAFAIACAKELGPLTTSDKLETGMDAALVLQELNHAKAAEACATALSSSHAAVRMIAARGLQRLHPKIKDDAAMCETVLKAVGEAGAKEQDERVLRVLYQVTNFSKDAPEFKFAQQAARALNQILATRVSQLSSGSHDESRDEAGLEAATACYKAAGPEQGELGRNVYGLLSAAVDRYLQPALDPSYRPVLAGLIGRIETALHGMIRDSNGKVPTQKIADLIKGKASADVSKQSKQVEAAMVELRSTLKGDPWRLQ
jgi:hypothetical protein